MLTAFLFLLLVPEGHFLFQVRFDSALQTLTWNYFILLLSTRPSLASAKFGFLSGLQSFNVL